MVSLEFFIWNNPPGRTMTESLTEMSTRNISWGVKAAGAWGWQPYHLHVPTVLKYGCHRLLSRPVMGLLYLNLYRGADKFLAWPGRKQANVSVRMLWISFGVLPCRKEKNVARVSMLLKSRASLTCFRACFLPGRNKGLSEPWNRAFQENVAIIVGAGDYRI